MEEPSCYPCPCKLCRELFEFDRFVDYSREEFSVNPVWSDSVEENVSVNSVKSVVWSDSVGENVSVDSVKSVGHTTSGLSSMSSPAVSSTTVSSPVVVPSPVYSPAVEVPPSPSVVHVQASPSPFVPFQAPFSNPAVRVPLFQAPLLRLVWIAVPVLLFTLFGFLLFFFARVGWDCLVFVVVVLVGIA